MTPREIHRLGAASACALAIALLAGCGGGGFDEPEAPPASMVPVVAAPQAAAPAAVVAPAPATLPVVSAPTPASELADVATQLALLRAEVAELRRRVNQGASAATAPRRDWPELAVDANHADPARLARAESAFRQEQPDPAWSTTAVAQLRGAFAEIGGTTQARLRQIECRARTCRIDLGPDTAHPPQDALPLLIGQLGGVFATADAIPLDAGSGPAASLLFFAR